ncbi:MAG: hypothetical protein K1W30_15660 [Lachnospiraceae bacterium]
MELLTLLIVDDEPIILKGLCEIICALRPTVFWYPYRSRHYSSACRNIMWRGYPAAP